VHESGESAPALDAVVDAVLVASRALVGVAARSLAAAEGEVTLPQYRALVVLVTTGPRRVQELADELAVNQSTVTRMCDRLERKRLISRIRPDGDRRSVIIDVTDGGRDLVGAVTRRRRADIRRMLKKLPPAAQTNLVSALHAFGEIAGEAPEQAWSLGWGA
jgi:DNA-binding MarR family transcriptional regulator